MTRGCVGMNRHSLSYFSVWGRLSIILGLALEFALRMTAYGAFLGC